MQAVMDKKEEVKEQIQRFFKKNQRARLFLKNATVTSGKDIINRLEHFYGEPTAANLINLMKALANSGTWIGHSTVRFLISLVDFDISEDLNLSEDEQYIVDCVSENREISYKKASYTEIFKSIYNDRELAHHNKNYVSKLIIPKVKPTLVLVSGVLNEIFSTAAFERGARHLANLHGVKYISPKVSGTKSSKLNVESLEEQLIDYIEANPDEKLWIIAFSKGGIDSLHFLKNNRDFAEKHVVGLSTIASPILGSQHVNHRLIKLVNSIHNFSENKIYKYFDNKLDILFKEFQKSLSYQFRNEWFKNNYDKLPKGIFYTALAMESEWYESHIWMILTKFFFQSDSINDGVVNADQALFPDYFKGLNLGIIRGHHLVGTRSSFYSQEALLEAHIIFLKYLKLID